MEQIIALNTIDKGIKKYNDLINYYLGDIKAISNKDYVEIKKELNNLDKVIVLPEDCRPFKPIIINMLSAFMVLQKRIEVGDGYTSELANELEERNVNIEDLQSHILKMQNLLKSNNIEVPEYNYINYESSVKSKEGFIKRFEAIEESRKKRKTSAVNKFISTLKQQGNIELPPKVMKKVAKESNVKINVGKNEKNIINSNK